MQIHNFSKSTYVCSWVSKDCAVIQIIWTTLKISRKKSTMDLHRRCNLGLHFKFQYLLNAPQAPPIYCLYNWLCHYSTDAVRSLVAHERELICDWLQPVCSQQDGANPIEGVSDRSGNGGRSNIQFSKSFSRERTETQQLIIVRCRANKLTTITSRNHHRHNHTFPFPAK